MKLKFFIILIVFLSVEGFAQKELIYLEAESFKNKGGWLIDQQSIEEVGSPFLLAHGLGKPVKDAETEIDVKKAGEYHIWVRTRNWVAPWTDAEAPGKFQFKINGNLIEKVFGTVGAEWSWHTGDKVQLNSGLNKVSLHDLTGFEGRCDAIIFAANEGFVPPNKKDDLEKLRKKQLNLHKKPKDGGSYDLVVVGGGMAGCCAAIAAARLGIKVALVQNRPVLGGNNSSEVRVGLSGLVIENAYPGLGKLVNEIGPVGHWNLYEANQNPDLESSQKVLEMIQNHPEKKEHNAGPASNYEDDKKIAIVKAEENISLFLNMHVFKAETKKKKINSVTAINIETGEETKFQGTYFADCTGDGNLGFLAGADYRVGRESKAETGEIRAPEVADNLVMGTSVQWNTEQTESETTFPECPWAVQFDESTCHYLTKGDWNWETGARRDQIKEIELIKDHAYRVVYGNWDYLKNRSKRKNEYAKRNLSWMAHIGGKRESRRLLGVVILKEQDILNKVEFPDGTVTSTWGIDLHYPVENNLGIEPYMARADVKEIEPFEIPYRSLYSRNIDNLFMAGRNISVTHVALGTVRVMRTGGMMGEVVGMAATICVHEECSPRTVYEHHLEVLRSYMVEGIPSK